MNFIEEEDFLFLQRSEDGGEVAFAFKERPGAGLMTTPSSLAMICARVVFPRPGGP